jgi:hypothetical protein
VVGGQRGPDSVRSADCFAKPGALDQIHLGGTLLQPIVADSVQDEPRRIGHDDHALRFLSHLPQLLHGALRERPERMLEPELEHLRLLGLNRGQQIRRIKARRKRAPPRLDDRRSQSGYGFGWQLRTEPAGRKQKLPASLQLSSAPQRIRSRADSEPLRRHGPAMISLTIRPGPFGASRPPQPALSASPTGYSSQWRGTSARPPFPATHRNRSTTGVTPSRAQQCVDPLGCVSVRGCSPAWLVLVGERASGRG